MKMRYSNIFKYKDDLEELIENMQTDRHATAWGEMENV